MAQKTINARISLRADTAANFASVNPILLKNELAIEKDTGKKKLGDGSSRYSALPYLEKTNWSEIENVPSSFNPAEHTHNYAGSSSAGGAATSANKINTDAGSATQPVYFKNGIPVKTTYTLNTNVPADAKFTDTIYTHPLTHAANMITGLADVATSGSYSDLSDKPTSMTADGGNADTVNGFTVNTNVPADAKFTDTVYTLPNATSSVLGGVKVGTNISVSNGTISVANGTTSTKGVVQLTNSTSSTSTTTAATPASVKSAYDLANSKQSPQTTIAGYGITDAYTKTEVDDKIASASGGDCLETTGGVLNGTTVIQEGDDYNPIITGSVYKTDSDNTAIYFVAASEPEFGSSQPQLLLSQDYGIARLYGPAIDIAGSDFAIISTGDFSADCSVVFMGGGMMSLSATKGVDINGKYIPTTINGYEADSAGNIEILAATTAKSGLLSAEDKTKLDAVENTYATKTELTAKANTADLASVATSGAYADLSGTPTSLKNPTSLTLQNSAGTSLGSYDGSTAKTIKLTASTVGLGNVTNESKATMFASAALTGTPTAPTAAATTNSTQIATTAFVNTVVNNKIAAADAMIYKGTIGTGGTVTALPNTHSTGWTYKVITAGTYAGVACNIGDMIICLTDGTAANNSHWTVIEGNIDGAVTGPASAVNARVAVFDGTTGKVIKDSGYTIATSVPSGAKFTDTTYSAATTSAAGLLSASDKSKLDGIASGANAYTHPSYTAKTSGLYKVTVDSTGHVSATSAVVKSDITDLGIPAQDTKYTHPSTHAASMITGLATVATSGKYSDLSGTPTIPTTLPANGGNADTVNGHTVKSNVPANAKFTDTVYTLPNATSSVLGGVKVGTNISVSNGTISVANGSTSAKGIVQLSSATNSTSTSLAATASAVKSAYDLANSKQSPSTTLSGYGITNAYTKSEVDTKINTLSTANVFATAVVTE